MGNFVLLAGDGQAEGERALFVPRVHKHLGGDAVAGFKADAKFADSLFIEINDFASGMDEKAAETPEVTGGYFTAVVADKQPVGFEDDSNVRLTTVGRVVGILSEF